MNVRPSSSGTSIVSNNPELMPIDCTPIVWSRSVRPSITSCRPSPPSSPGVAVVSAAADTPGNAAERVDDLAVKGRSRSQVVVGVAGQIAGGADDRPVIEAEAGGLHREEALHHQVGANQQRETERHLRDDEPGLQALACSPKRGATAAFLQVVDEIRAHRAQRRQAHRPRTS